MDARTFGQDIAHINLSTGTVTMKPAPKQWVEKYIGGRGLGVRYVLENGVDVDPLSPELGGTSSEPPAIVDVM